MPPQIGYLSLRITPFHPGEDGELEARPDLALHVCKFPGAKLEDNGKWTNLMKRRVSGDLSGAFSDIRMCFCQRFDLQNASKWDGFGAKAPKVWVAKTVLQTFGLDGKPKVQVMDMDPRSIPWKEEALRGNCGRMSDGTNAKWPVGGVTNLIIQLERHLTETGSFKGICKYNDYRKAIDTLRDDLATHEWNQVARGKAEAKKPTLFVDRYVEGELVPIDASLRIDPAEAAGFKA